MRMITDEGNAWKIVIWLGKILFSLCILAAIFHSLIIDGFAPYYSYMDDNYQTDLSAGQLKTLQDYSEVEQTFTATGNILNNVSLYTGQAGNEILTVSIYSSDGKLIAESVLDTAQCKNDAWNKIGLAATKLSRGETYRMVVSSDSDLSSVYCSASGAPAVFAGCQAKGSDIGGVLAAGVQFTYRHLTLASMCELALKIMISLLLGMILCFSVFKIEELYQSFRKSTEKKGFFYALYFSVSLVLLYNPLETIRNEMTEFRRVIGAGVIENVDVSKRISNFNHWFLLFAVSFLLFFLFFHYLLRKEKSEEAKKVESFLNHFMILADCSLLLSCITYFDEESQPVSVYHFSAYAVMLIAVTALSYLCLHLDQNVSADHFARLNVIGVSLSIPITVLGAVDLGTGRMLLAVSAVAIIVIVVFCRFGGRLMAGKRFDAVSNAGVLCLSAIPLLTSLYIEGIHVLNQYHVFIARPAVCYEIMVLLVIAASGGLFVLARKKEIRIRNWKTWAYPCLAAGTALLAIQIPISSVYEPDIFEAANHSVQISDFFNHGSIPIVQHFGAHMTEGVWGGILYGVINHDYAGAVVSPYLSLIEPVLVVLFYYFVKKIWNEDIALLTALMFPFYSFWSYYGLGMFICLAAMAYVRKNGYVRAALVWAACIFCAIYRIDLGFAFGIAAIISLLIYIVVNRKWKAIKELGFTLAGWGIIGIAAWFALCLVKGVHPINRLIEFLKLCLSNLNWAYADIGETGNTLFAWSYMIIPFFIIICLLYTVFAKNMRDRIGDQKWVLLLILGSSYFVNFSRGLVRHSLVEVKTYIILWCAYLFLAVFLSCYKDNKKLFLPAFLILLLCDTVFVQDENFTQAAFVDEAVSSPEEIMESWWEKSASLEDGRQVTYWEQLKQNQQVVERVQLGDALQKYVDKYDVLNVLLDEDETFVDFMNKTLLYSLNGKRNPAYISQSPLQLSGEFTQEEFIKEITGVSLVLMPADAGNYRASNSLDGITNAYRNYKAAEYIYQNYVPLCLYGSDYAIWCLRDSYDKYSDRLSALITETDYLAKLPDSEGIIKNNVALSAEKHGAVTMTCTGDDPYVAELQTVIDISQYINKDLCIRMEYAADGPGTMQLYYTTDAGENYTDEKMVPVEMEGSKTAEFVIPVTEYTKIRLDIPEGSRVKVKSLTAKSVIEYADYGYDGPYRNGGGDGNFSYDYKDGLHNHSLGILPEIWAEKDKENAAGNTVITDLSYKNNLFLFDENSFIPGKNGNYLKIAASYDGVDSGGLFYDDDEQLDGIVILGRYEDGIFEEKCRYTMSFEEGMHDYLIRCSADYYWYTGDINAVSVQSDGELHVPKVQILEGD